MTEQAYYRLDELPAMGITEGKLRYLLEQQQVTPAFFMHNERFIVGGYLSNKFVGFAVADYSGLVTIHKQLIPELLAKGKVSVKQVLLMQKERIRVIATTYPFQVKMPNRYIESWQPNDLTKLGWEAYPALFMPMENVGVLHQLVDMLQGLGGSTGNKMDYGRYTDGMPQTELVVLAKDLRFAESCVCSANVHQEKAKAETGAFVTTAKLMRKREIETLLMKVMAAFPNHRPAQIWEVLKTDHYRKERVYDTEEILDQVGESELIWSDLDGCANTLRKKSFFNLIGKLR